MHRPKLLIATRNLGKMREYRRLLQDVPFDLVSLDGLAIAEEVQETGQTFHENARVKASEYAALSGLLTLADDSGLEVDALGGEPGIFSARYGDPALPPLDMGGLGGVAFRKGGTEEISDQDRAALLLRNLEGVPWERRTARFRCVIAIAPLPSPPYHETPPFPPLARGGMGGFALMVGSVAGMIQYESQGDEGFGYDPVFYLPSYHQTMAQIPLEEKNRISHRSDAARKAVAVLQKIAISFQRSAINPGQQAES